MIENTDPFKIMDMLGIKDQLHCFDMIQSVRNEVIKIKQIEGESNG